MIGNRLIGQTAWITEQRIEYLTTDVKNLEDLFAKGYTTRRNVEQFVLSFDTGLRPMVGQQVTVTAANAQQTDITARVNLLVQRAVVTSPRPECELIAKGVIGSEARGWVMNASQSFVPDRSADAALPLSGLLRDRKSVV